MITLRKVKQLSRKAAFKPEEFYSRQVVLAELGRQGQEKLRRSRVAVVGLGGLGTASALYLALAGVGHLRLIDQDTVELKNLHRQILYSLDNLRYPKVEAAAERIQHMNPDVTIEPVPENVNESNIDDIVCDVNCVVDGLDNMRTRYLLNRACVRNRIPYVFGAAIGVEGNLSVLHSPETPCLECFLPGLDDRQLPTCDTRGVLGATTGIIGSLQAMEAVKLLADMGGSLKGKLMVCDFRDMYFTTIEIFKRPDCPVCGAKTAPAVAKEAEQLAVLCGSNTFNVNPQQPIKLSLNQIYLKLKSQFKILLKSSLVIVFRYERGIEVSLFNGGRMLIKNVKDEKSALTVRKAVYMTLGLKTPD
ncbi:MAG TPA: HesA/MoeB/ThiF family protein [Candidatus Bathyarchaeia archaeon]|nr:HesA/MoeB/ThiF family protein [Candidatus Bathyarchaeia archaeon]